jgi:hypothetical protein
MTHPRRLPWATPQGAPEGYWVLLVGVLHLSTALFVTWIVGWVDAVLMSSLAVSAGALLAAQAAGAFVAGLVLGSRARVVRLNFALLGSLLAAATSVTLGVLGVAPELGPPMAIPFPNTPTSWGAALGTLSVCVAAAATLGVLVGQRLRSGRGSAA